MNNNKNKKKFRMPAAVGEWNNFLNPLIQFQELISKITVSTSAPAGIMTMFSQYPLSCTVNIKKWG